MKLASWLKAHSACTDGFAWARDLTPAEAWAAAAWAAEHRELCAIIRGIIPMPNIQEAE